MADGLRRFLVTAAIGERIDLWAASAAFTNWFEGRGPEERETWFLVCVAEHADAFVEAARKLGVTVEEIEGAGDDERYTLLAGEPGTGWKPDAVTPGAGIREEVPK